MKVRLFLLALCCLPLVVGCAAASADSDLPSVRLNDLRPLPPTPPAEVLPLRVAVAAATRTSPKATPATWSPTSTAS